MKLTSNEQVMLQQLERQVEGFHRLRWFFLLAGVLMLSMSVGLYGFFLFSGEPSWAGEFGRHPAFYLLAIIGGYAINQSYCGFKGSPEKELLIKVIKHNAKNS